ncbi:MAG TPA: hypothetical protein QF417_04070 [Acidimicrobiales bacterium]|jgi:cytochrome c oxidase subunit IV|nr:hypothetical protein [Actinomycetes bacterium]MDP6106200.1 hypothetical protein [Acidimicrobiales bacterium]MDP6240160.1 hypothetical protein [Acidimicrobiales bacterium]MDP7123672.1 hypothetical protein [Acidimicrobiales bacterium]MDP7352177.1 hypothetical protein [Acidimicrobiales bacterium]|tara:strand:- start:1973 stop:2200 length:228 start_codon:yes stop_codon:yes gene_type:complete
MAEQAHGTFGRAGLIRRGWLTAAGLAVLTLLEYLVAVRIDAPTLWLLPFIAAKGGLILEVFMHASDLRAGDREHV